MEIHPIRNEDDYKQVMAEIDRIILAAPGTPEGDLLEVLAVLASDYERRYHAIPPQAQAA
jgi:HTH-type transcriptional regulator/antitoxin HigA